MVVRPIHGEYKAFGTSLRNLPWTPFFSEDIEDVVWYTCPLA